MELNAADDDLKAVIEFSPNVTKKFIKLRGETFLKKFTGIRGSVAVGFTAVLEELNVFVTDENIKKCKKKWENLNKQYKECKKPRSGVGIENGEDSRVTWEFFDDMEEVMVKDHNVEPPTLVNTENIETEEEGDALNSSVASTSSETRSKKRSLLSEPNGNEKKKKLTMSERLEKQASADDKFGRQLVKLFRKDQKDRIRSHELVKSQLKQSNAFMGLLAASTLGANSPPEAKEMVKAIMEGFKAGPPEEEPSGPSSSSSEESDD